MEEFLQFLKQSQEQLQSQQDQLQNQKSKVVQNQQQTEESATKYFDKLVKLCKTRESNVIKQIRISYNQSLKLLEEQSHIIQTILDQVQKISEQMQASNYEGIDQNKIKEQIEFQKSLPNTPIPLFDFQIKEFQSNTLQSYINEIGDIVLKYQLTMNFEASTTNKTQVYENGSCEHVPSNYMLWKFKCCEKAYPCIQCHNKYSNHSLEGKSLTRDIACGFCLTEQQAPYGKYACKSCGKQLSQQN